MMEMPGVRSRSVRRHAPGGARGTLPGGAVAGTLVNQSLPETDFVNHPLLETEMRFQS